MKTWIENEIERSLIKIKPAVPSKDFIKTYNDFLKVKDYFIYYNFNSDVLENLIIIANDVYLNQKRHNKKVLFNALKSYYSKKHKNYKLPKTALDLIFNIFKKAVFESNEYVKSCSNFLLIDCQLNESQIQWLTENFDVSGMVFNRLLRYPAKSKLISDWAFKNYEHQMIRNRRAEVASWILNEQPRFLVSEETLLKDFYCMNKADEKEYFTFYYTDDLVKTDKKPNSADENATQEQEMQNLYVKRDSYFSFKHTRFYERKFSDDFDAELTKKDFVENLNKHLTKTRLWALYYSHLDIKTKEKRITDLYDQSVAPTFLYIAKKLKSMRLLKWLSKQI